MTNYFVTVENKNTGKKNQYVSEFFTAAETWSTACAEGWFVSAVDEIAN